MPHVNDCSPSSPKDPRDEGWCYMDAAVPVDKKERVNRLDAYTRLATPAATDAIVVTILFCLVAWMIGLQGMSFIKMYLSAFIPILLGACFLYVIFYEYEQIER